jgi:hypothetical protein
MIGIATLTMRVPAALAETVGERHERGRVKQMAGDLAGAAPDLDRALELESGLLPAKR